MRIIPQTDWKALDKNILAVAKVTGENCWCAYVGIVAGKSHEREWRGVVLNGTKLEVDVALVLFPAFEGFGLYDDR